jgi:hypothetical protein
MLRRLTPFFLVCSLAHGQAVVTGAVDIVNGIQDVQKCLAASDSTVDFCRMAAEKKFAREKMQFSVTKGPLLGTNRSFQIKVTHGQTTLNTTYFTGPDCGTGGSHQTPEQQQLPIRRLAQFIEVPGVQRMPGMLPSKDSAVCTADRQELDGKIVSFNSTFGQGFATVNGTCQRICEDDHIYVSDGAGQPSCVKCGSVAALEVNYGLAFAPGEKLAKKYTKTDPQRNVCVNQNSCPVSSFGTKSKTEKEECGFDCKEHQRFDGEQCIDDEAFCQRNFSESNFDWSEVNNLMTLPRFGRCSGAELFTIGKRIEQDFKRKLKEARAECEAFPSMRIAESQSMKVIFSSGQDLENEVVKQCVLGNSTIPPTKAFTIPRLNELIYDNQ